MKPLFRKILLSFLGILFALLLGEMILRIFDYQGISLMKKDRALGQIYKPNPHANVYSEESDQFIPIRINSMGFRDHDHSFGRSDKKRMVILGDSFGAGFSVRFEDTFPQQCEKYLNEHSPSQWEVINLSVAGFGTAQEMLAYREMGRKFHPDVVVLFFFPGNDISDNSSELSTNPRIYFTLDDKGNLVQEPGGRLRSEASSFLNDHSRLYLWQKVQMKKLENYYKYKVRLNPAYHAFLANYDKKTMRAWQITEKLLASLAGIAAGESTTFLVVAIPFPDAIYPQWWSETLAASPPMRKEMWDLSKPERLLALFCRQNKIAFYSPADTFRAEAAQTYYFKHGHFNKAGHARIGQLLAEQILRKASLNIRKNHKN
ncbi:MAG TPA: SGNH/GDSL hydrolase family protein [Acidobacteriota bacterium]